MITAQLGNFITDGAVRYGPNTRRYHAYREERNDNDDGMMINDGDA